MVRILVVIIAPVVLIAAFVSVFYRESRITFWLARNEAAREWASLRDVWRRDTFLPAELDAPAQPEDFL